MEFSLWACFSLEIIASHINVHIPGVGIAFWSWYVSLPVSIDPCCSAWPIPLVLSFHATVLRNQLAVNIQLRT